MYCHMYLPFWLDRPHFFSTGHRDMRHRTTAPFFRLKFSRYRISATAAPRHLILSPPRHILGEKIRVIKNASLSRIFDKILVQNNFTLCTNNQSWALATIFATMRQCREAEKWSLVELSLNIRKLSHCCCREENCR